MLDSPDGKRQHFLTRDNPDAIPVAVPAIVSESLWEAAQEQRVDNRRKFRHPTRYDYPLRGRIHCALCGACVGSSRPRKNGSLYRRYRCVHNNTNYPGPDRCHAGSINADCVEQLVWEAVKTAMLDTARMLVAVRKRQEEAAGARRVIEQTLAALVALDSRAQIKLERFLDLCGAGEMDKPTYLAKKREIGAEMTARASERQTLEKRLGECAVLTPDQETQLAEFRAKVAARMAGPVPAAEQAKLYELLRLECVYDDTTGDLTVSGLMGDTRLSVIPTGCRACRTARTRSAGSCRRPWSCGGRAPGGRRDGPARPCSWPGPS
jgi:hypothetical protein